MFCENCGTQLPDGALFCPNCGNKLPDAPAAETETQAQPHEYQPQGQTNDYQAQEQPGAYQPQGQPHEYQPQRQTNEYQAQEQPDAYQPQGQPMEDNQFSQKVGQATTQIVEKASSGIAVIMPYKNILLIIGCVMSIISVFLPYLKVDAYYITYSVRLIQGDGFIYIGLGVALLVLVLMYKALPIFILSIINFAIMIINTAWAAYITSASFFGYSLDGLTKKGAGFVLLIISAIIIIICGIMYFIERNAQKKAGM